MQTQRGAAPGPGLVAPELTARGQGSVCPPPLPLQPSQPTQDGAGAALGRYSTGWLAGWLGVPCPSPPSSIVPSYTPLRSASDAPGPSVTQQTVPALGEGRRHSVPGCVIFVGLAQFYKFHLPYLVHPRDTEAGTMIMPTSRMRNRVRGNVASASSQS